MPLLYILLGGIIVILGYNVYKLIREFISKLKTSRHKINISDLKQIKTDIDKLKSALSELAVEMKDLQELTKETQTTNTLLFPEHFEQDATEGKTIFVKDGKEKPYETIDWRSR